MMGAEGGSFSRVGFLVSPLGEQADCWLKRGFSCTQGGTTSPPFLRPRRQGTTHQRTLQTNRHQPFWMELRFGLPHFWEKQSASMLGKAQPHATAIRTGVGQLAFAGTASQRAALCTGKSSETLPVSPLPKVSHQKTYP
jgi:hypothetical protein